MENLRRLTPKESALHILTMLREDVGCFPARATPKYPLPAIMQAEKQRELLDQFAEDAGCDLVCLGTDEVELNALVAKAAILRDRANKRLAKMNGGV